MEDKQKNSILKKIGQRIKEQEGKLDGVLGTPGISEQEISKILGIIEQLEKAQKYCLKKK